MTPLVVAFYVVPPICAIALARYSKSKNARSVLMTTGATCLCLFALLLVAHIDCDYREFAFLDCRRLPKQISDMFGVLQSLYGLAYLFAGPVLLVIAAIAEMIARSRA